MARKKSGYTRREIKTEMRRIGTKKEVAEGGGFINQQAGRRTTGPKKSKKKK